MYPIETTKEAYNIPETISIELAPRDSVLQDISIPGGDVPGLGGEE